MIDNGHSLFGYPGIQDITRNCLGNELVPAPYNLFGTFDPTFDPHKTRRVSGVGHNLTKSVCRGC